MGCSFGKDTGNNSRRGTMYGRRNTIVTQPVVNVTEGEGVNIKDINGTKVIFIFGGPGSGKGTIVNNLISMFNYRFICGEDLILEELVHKILPNENDMGTATTRSLASQLSEDSSQLTLEWALSLVDREVQKYPGETVLVDVIPNLKFLLRVPTFVKNCTREMKEFEEKHPVMFAIDLSLDSDHLIQNITATHACTKAPKTGTSEGGSSDEMDTSRTQRRFNVYMESVKEFLKYFSSSQRLTVVDTACGKIDAVWESLRDYLTDSGISKPCFGLEQVVLFAFEEHQYEDIDRNRYPLCQLRSKDLVSDVQTATPAKLLKRLISKMTENASCVKGFEIDICGTQLTSLEAVEKHTENMLMFVEVEIGQLDFFMFGLKRKTQRKKSLVRKAAQNFKVVTTSDGDALLFPEDTETELCRRIAIAFYMTKHS